MARNLLPIRILFHMTFAFVYLPMIGLGFTWGLSQVARGVVDRSFVMNHFDGITALAALVGLGILATLDILTIRRKVNQRAFLAIEIIVVVLMPLSMWPIIIAAIWAIWTDQLTRLYYELPWFAYVWHLIGIPTLQDTFTSAAVIAATVAILGLNIAFVGYICITAVIDKIHGNKFLLVDLGESSLSSTVPQKWWRIFGTQRKSTERAEMVRHCADYIFRHSIFRKHTFEPTAWAIFRGIIAVYSCIGILVFSAYSGYVELQLHSNRAYTVTDAMLGSTMCWQVADDFNTTSVAADMASMDSNNGSETLDLSPGTNFVEVEGRWTWWSDSRHSPTEFEMVWTGNSTLFLWVTMANSIGDAKSLQANLTSPLILAPFKQYTISLGMMKYMLGSFWFISYHPDVITSVDSASGSNTSAVTFLFNNYCQAVIQRQLSSPSIFSAIAHILSEIGGTLAFIDGVFTLIFGRTILGIIFGTRTISPFGMLGMVTHNRFKTLIHQQFPQMQKDIEHGGMAAYISEVAIDAALIGPFAKGNTSLSQISRSGDAIELRRRQTGSSTSDPWSPSVCEEVEDTESSPLVSRRADNA